VPDGRRDVKRDKKLIRLRKLDVHNQALKATPVIDQHLHPANSPDNQNSGTATSPE
jgi:hypothetical protein